MLGRVPLIVAAIVAAGLALAGWFVGRGFQQARLVDRFVTVKGLSEREVKADLALWPLHLVATDDDLGRAQAKLDRSVQLALDFLGRQGIDTTETERQGLTVTDLLANPYRGNGPVESRYIITETVMVRSERPEVVQAASQRVGELVESGVVLSSQGPMGGGPTFLFTRLNDLKPSMIAEATANAREGAEKFAADSRSAVGGIRRANQGVFVILPRDKAPGVSEESQLYKTVRVVSTIDYYLDD